MKKNCKYLTLIFSDNCGEPSKNYKPIGYGGFCHNEIGYLQRLIIIAGNLNRKAVFPLPWISLCHKHNNNKPVNKHTTWSIYLNLDNINNLEKKPPFSFNNNGGIVTDLSIAYYPSNILINNIDHIDHSVDIIALVNYDSVDNLKRYSYLPTWTPQKRKYPTSDLLINYAKMILSKFNLDRFTFIHIRRGDFLDNYKLAPPKGTRPYTSAEYVSNFIKKYITNKKIIIATDEKDFDYKKKLVMLLQSYKLIFEEEYYKYLPNNILNDNYCIYLILHEIARRADINIGTYGYVRIGDKYDLSLSKLI